MFRSGHDPSTPQDHPGHKERAALGMTAEEKERGAEEKSGHGPEQSGAWPRRAFRGLRRAVPLRGTDSGGG